MSDLITACDLELARDSTLRGFVDRCIVLLRPTNEFPLDWPALPLPITIRETAPSYFV